MNKLVLGTAVAVVGLLAAGFGVGGVAAAAPTAPSPVSTAPASADAAPMPVPLVYQPVNASDGFYGMRRGSVPPASTADLSPVPIVNRLPVIGVTPFPATGDEPTGDESGTNESGTGTDDATDQ